MEAPLLDYYRSMQGRWRGALTLRVTDHALFRAAKMPRLDRLRARATAALPSLRMSTSLACGAEVVHTTRLSAFGVPMFRSVERFSIAPDGRSASIRGDVWYPPIPWRMADLGDGRVDVHDDARGATYRFRAFGVDVVQTTRVEEEHALRIVQDFGWGRGDVVLRRRR